MIGSMKCIGGASSAVLAMYPRSRSGITASILAMASARRLGQLLVGPGLSTMRAPSTSASISASLNISGGRSNPARST